MKEKKFTEEEIKQMAKDFVEELFNIKDWEIECPICTAINCINNDSCINCNYNLK